MPDDTDLSVDMEEKIHALRLNVAAEAARMQLTPAEEPDEDEDGNRYCLDCGDAIPAARVASVNAVRCTDCASARERKRKPT